MLYRSFTPAVSLASWMTFVTICCRSLSISTVRFPMAVLRPGIILPIPSRKPLPPPPLPSPLLPKLPRATSLVGLISTSRSPTLDVFSCSSR